MPLTSRSPSNDSLWLLTIAPTIWAGHFLLCYITAAIWCAKFAAPGGSLGDVRTAVFWYTLFALVAIAWVGWEGFRRHGYVSIDEHREGRPAAGSEATTHDLDTPEDRHRFLGFATFLLSGLSAVAVLYAGVAAAFFETCQ